MKQQQAIDFTKQYETLVTEVIDRQKVVASAIAVALVKDQDIPTSAVNDPSAHYINQISPRLRIALSDFNEGVVFDIRYALELARQLWLVRYFACHGTVVSMFKPEFSFIENYMGASQALSQDLAAVLNKHQVAIGLLAASVTTIVASTKEGV